MVYTKGVWDHRSIASTTTCVLPHFPEATKTNTHEAVYKGTFQRNWICQKCCILMHFWLKRMTSWQLISKSVTQTRLNNTASLPTLCEYSWSWPVLRCSCWLKDDSSARSTTVKISRSLSLAIWLPALPKARSEASAAHNGVGISVNDVLLIITHYSIAGGAGMMVGYKVACRCQRL